MKTLEESVLAAMDCTDKEILPYLSYLLQDFWELGSNPDVIISLIKKFFSTGKLCKVLDLGCGKGIVSVKIAKQLGYECHGIDAIPEFISFAVLKADEYNVSNLCKFEVGDIREKVRAPGQYDVIILASIGRVFGNYFDTLSTLDKNLKKDGIIIIDDGYIEERSNFKHEQVFNKCEIKKQILRAGMQLIDEVIANDDDKTSANYNTEYRYLSKRCQELIDKYPDKAETFRNFCNQQKKEYDILKNQITCSTMVVKRIKQ